MALGIVATECHASHEESEIDRFWVKRYSSRRRRRVDDQRHIMEGLNEIEAEHREMEDILADAAMDDWDYIPYSGFRGRLDRKVRGYQKALDYWDDDPFGDEPYYPIEGGPDDFDAEDIWGPPWLHSEIDYTS